MSAFIRSVLLAVVVAAGDAIRGPGRSRLGSIHNLQTPARNWSRDMVSNDDWRTA
jgi:hypothetical protein